MKTSTKGDKFDHIEAPPNLVPVTTISDLCPVSHSIRCMKPEFESGGIFPFEMICMNMMAVHFAPERIFEFGTFNGRTTLNLAVNSRPGTRIFTLDLPFDNPPSTKLRQHPWDGKYVEQHGDGRYFQKERHRKKITRLYGDSATFDYTPFGGTIDFVFVDGSHSYEYVTNDSDKALRLLRGGKGIILWHDYGTKWHEVTRALNDLYAKNPVFKGMRFIRGTSLVFLRFE